MMSQPYDYDSLAWLETQPRVPLLDVLSTCVRGRNMEIGVMDAYKQYFVDFFEEVRTMMPNDCVVKRNDDFFGTRDDDCAVSCKNLETQESWYVSSAEMNRVIKSGFPFADLTRLGKKHDPKGLLRELWGDNKRAYFRLLTTEESRRQLETRPDMIIYCFGAKLSGSKYNQRMEVANKGLRGLLRAPVWFANESGTTWLIPHYQIFLREERAFNFGRGSPGSRGSRRSPRRSRRSQSQTKRRGSRGSRRSRGSPRSHKSSTRKRRSRNYFLR